MTNTAVVLIGQGRNVADATKQIGITDKNYFRWRKTNGGLRIDHAKRLRGIASARIEVPKDAQHLG